MYVDSAGNLTTDITAGVQWDANDQIEFAHSVEVALRSPGVLVVGGTETDQDAQGNPYERLYDLSNVGRTRLVDGLPNHYVHGVDLAAPAKLSKVATLGGYGANEGTSMSTPQVSAAVALLRSLIPKLPVTTRQDDLEDPCTVPTKGVVEYIRCTTIPFTLWSPRHDQEGLPNPEMNHGLLNVFAALDAAYADARYTSLYGPDGFGDLDLDGQKTGADVDLMYGAVNYFSDPTHVETSWHLLHFDVDRDGQVYHFVDWVNEQVIGDVAHLIVDMMHITFGDSNIDGVFNSGDLVMVFDNGEYEDTIPLNSGWVEGDWNGDSEFNEADLDFVAMLGTYSG